MTTSRTSARRGQGRKVWTAEEVRKLGVRTNLVTAGEVLGISKNTAHDLARREEFPVPVLRLGHKYVVPTAGLLRVLGLDESAEGSKPIEAA